VKNSTENVLVMVRSRLTLRGDRDLPRLAEVVSHSPGWRLDLVVRNPRSRTSSEDGLELPTGAEVADRLSHVRELVQRDELDAAALLA
jgi:REase_AHJR-like